MPFESSDPRSTLANPVDISSVPEGAFAEAQLIGFDAATAQISDAGSRTWYVRTQNFVVGVTEAVEGDVITRESGPFEMLVALPDEGTHLKVDTQGSSRTVKDRSVLVLPGACRIEVLQPAIIVRVFTSQAPEVELCLNKDAYRQIAPVVAVQEFRVADTSLRSYSLEDYPSSPDRFGHIFRSDNLMVNFIATRSGPRDVRRLSPHSHADFEQCSIQLSGKFSHHVRTPWTSDMTTWRPDQKLDLVGPGAVIFPPPLIHTSQATGSGDNRLLDVFAPPRQDFLNQKGWVLNAADFD